MSRVYFDNQSAGKVKLWKSGKVNSLEPLLLSVLVEYYLYRAQHTASSIIVPTTLIPLLTPFGLTLEEAESKINEWRAQGLLTMELQNGKAVLTLNL